MKGHRITLLMAFSLALTFNALSVLPGTWKNITISSNAIDRNFKVYIPSQVNQAESKRVLYMFHGTSQNAARMIEITGWAEKAEQEKFIAIFPNSLKYNLIDIDSTAHTSRWNDGTLKLMQNEDPADDVQFFRDMQVWLIQNYGGVEKVFVSGFSNGAAFVSRLLQEVPDQITAAGIVSTKVPFPYANTNLRPVPTLLIYGTKDARIQLEIEQRQLVLPKNHSDFISCPLIQEVVAFNTSRNQLTSIPTDQGKLTNPKGYNWIYEETNQIQFSKHHFEIQLYEDLTHRYPANNDIPNQLNATTIFWDFFTNY